MKSSEIRQKFLAFYEKNGHAVIPSASLLPENDSSTLFTSSGMQPLVPYLLGEKHPEGIRLCNSQKSFRVVDIDEVGDNRHDTFFEMLGNWSLGDYFKKEQLHFVYSFLVEEIGLDVSRLYATVFRGDESINIPKDLESVETLKEVFKSFGIEAKDVDFAEKDGMGEGRIFYYPVEKNWWSRSGVPANMPVGEPGGPDSEIFYDLGADLQKHENSQWANMPCHINCDCGRFIEIGNSVFMQYQKTALGFEELAQKNVDFGGGLERITMASQDKDDVFQTDLFLPIMQKLEELSGKKSEENKKSFRIVADHAKASVFLLADGIEPSNLGRGYILRRIIRRAIRHAKQLGLKDDFFAEIYPFVVKIYDGFYPEIENKKDLILTEFKNEKEKFEKTIEGGLKEIAKWFNDETSAQITGLTGNYRVNRDYVNEVCKDLGKKLFFLFQEQGFPPEMAIEELENKYVGLIFFKDEILKSFQTELEKHQELSRTASAGMFKGGLADASEETTKLHTAAHLMLAGLRKVLGPDVYQKGSNITAERLRFDFSHNEKMTSGQIKDVENFVNGIIEKDLPVWFEEMPIEKAREINAMGIFESKYGQMVKVYFVGKDEENVSREICGGPHVEHTGVLGHFKIQKEESSSSGVRRIKAVLE